MFKLFFSLLIITTIPLLAKDDKPHHPSFVKHYDAPTHRISQIESTGNKVTITTNDHIRWHIYLEKSKNRVRSDWQVGDDLVLYRNFSPFKGGNCWFHNTTREGHTYCGLSRSQPTNLPLHKVNSIREHDRFIELELIKNGHRKIYKVSSELQTRLQMNQWEVGDKVVFGSSKSLRLNVTVGEGFILNINRNSCATVFDKNHVFLN